MRYLLPLSACLVLTSASLANAHDYKRPELDGWYGALKRPGTAGSFTGALSCCSKTDCHTTEAELRGDFWWARLGVPTKEGDWELRDWVRISPVAVLERHDNPTGESVICHDLAWKVGGNDLDPADTKVWCFIPGSET